MGAVAFRPQFSLSRVIEGVYFRENKSVASYRGWHGVGMSRAAKAVAKAAKDSHLFDVVVFVRAGEECSPGKLQRRIAKQLEISHDDSEEEEDIDEAVARKIYKSLGGRNFLLIIDNLLDAQGIKLALLGVPTHQEWYGYKIFITTPNWEVISAMDSEYVTVLSAPQFEEVPPNIRVDDIWDIVGVDELLEHFQDEAGEVADAVSNNNAIRDLHIQVLWDEVLDCFIYLCLVQKQEANEKELMKYYVGEGLIRSLLQDGKEMEHLGAAFKVGQALLGEMVSHFMVERSSPHDDGKLSVNSHLWEILEKKEGIDYLKQRLHIQLEATHVLEHDAKWMALSNKNNIQTLLQQQPYYKNPQLTTLLLNDNPQLAEIPNNFFLGIPNLKVLDLSRTSISSLPPSLLSLVHLRFLKLRECSSLNSLPPTLLKDLKQLLILDLHATPISNIPTEAFEQMPHLRLLDLSHANIHSLSGCGSLIRQLSELEELDISGCEALEDVENVSFEDVPKLRVVNLCNTKITHLSFTRCRSLEIVRLQGLANLRSLHLSSLKMEEFPWEISELKCLEQLQLTDVQHLERVDWQKVRWLPEKLKWDQCGCSTASALRPEEQSVNRASSAIVSVSNANIFRGLATDSPIWENCLSKFLIYISPCSEQNKKKQKEKVAVVDVKKRKPRAYAGIHSKMDPDFKRKAEGLSRHLEIEGVDGVLHRSIKTVVAKAEVLWLRENGLVESLSTDLGVEDAEGVKECRVERCHNMDHLFPGYTRQVSGLKGRLWVSDMGSLKSVFDGEYCYFLHLKHLHIECCPKLDKLFGGRYANANLSKLETLHVRFCARLECVEGFLFRELRSLQLWELPKLSQISTGYLSRSLSRVRVRACPKLQQLPTIVTSAKGRITIEAESDWWTNLNWDNQRYVKKETIDFKSSSANNP